MQFGNVSLFIRKVMKYLFDLDKLYFATWLQLHNSDPPPPYEGAEGSSFFYFFALSTESEITPLYYAALCRFQDLIEQLVVEYPQYANY